MEKYIAMIPARLGSQRIPKKNIRIMVDKPLIDYPIDLCIESKSFDEIYINTESEELGKYAMHKGIKFYKRPQHLASNNATNRDFMYDFLKKHDCEYVIMVNPTSPLLKLNTLTSFVDFIKNNNYDTIFSIISEKTECFYNNKPINFNVEEKINSQFLEPVMKTVWAITAWKKSNFITMQENGKNPIFGGHIGFYNIPKDESCDLDTEEDWNIAERMLFGNRLEKEIIYLDLEKYK